MTNTDAIHEKIVDLFEKEFEGFSTSDISYAIGVLEAMRLQRKFEEGRISYEEYMEAIGLAA